MSGLLNRVFERDGYIGVSESPAGGRLYIPFQVNMAA